MLTIKIRYMKHLKILTIAAAAAFLCSCERDDVGQYEKTDDAIEFNISIESGSSSRVNYEDPHLTKTKFEVGDVIAIWVMKRPIYQQEPELPMEGNNARLINFLLTLTEDGTWQFKRDPNTRLIREPGYRYDYYAYYTSNPITGIWGAVNPMDLTYSATSGKMAVNSDFMAAINTDCPDGTTVVNLRFKHLVSMFEVRQPGLGRNASVRLFSPKIMASGRANFSKLPEDPTFFTTDNQFDPGAQVVTSVDFKVASNGRYRVWLPPQNLPAGEDTYLEICSDRNNKTDNNTIIYNIKPTNGGEIEFVRSQSRYLESIPNFNPELLNTPNSILFTSRLGQVKRVPVAKAYAMWMNDPALKATRPSLYGDLSLKMLWTDTKDFANIYEVKLDDPNKGAAAKIEMRIKGTGAALKYEANAVYGLFIGDTLRWSWHIWAASDQRPDENLIQYNNGPIFMSANLGSWPSKTTKIKGTGATTEWAPLSGAGRGLLYQYGRKDPFPGAAYDGWDFTKYQPIYNDTAVVVNATCPLGIFVNNSSAVSNVDSTTINPMAFASNWNPTNTLELWNATGAKSPYDPCPAGWRVGVAEQSVWYKDGSTNLSGYTDNAWDNGIMFEKEDYKHGYYPQTNYRTASGEFAATGSISMWHGGANGNSFTVDRQSSQINTNATSNKALGMTVRCVRDLNDKEIWDPTIGPNYYVWKSFGGKLEVK